MTLGAVKAGEAYTALTARDQMRPGLAAGERSIKRFADRVQSMAVAIGNLMSQALQQGVQAMIQYTTDAIRMAGDYAETLSKFEAVFGEQAEAAEQWADATSKAVGRFSGDLKEALATFQAFFRGQGFAAEESRRLAEQLTQTGLDLASFHNIADDEAMQRLQAALAGSSEVLDRFGIDLRGVGAGLETTERLMARLSAIMEALDQQNVLGDAERTAGSFNNQLKQMEGHFREMQIAFGEALAAGAESNLEQVNTQIGVMKQLYLDILESAGKINENVEVQAGKTMAIYAIMGRWRAELEQVNWLLESISGKIDEGPGAAAGRGLAAAGAMQAQAPPADYWSKNITYAINDIRGKFNWELTKAARQFPEWGRAYNRFLSMARGAAEAEQLRLTKQAEMLKAQIGTFQAAGPIGPTITGSLEAFQKEQQLKQDDMAERQMAQSTRATEKLTAIERILRAFSIERI